ncbi:MAG: tRNA (adenosine(37)-N6)-threonylcarbamoyltransferase complex transferase subunit TsaD, partial [Chitinophagales bacterium]|nr:tRNA (adenosine(37)-N6)-threonylcarbamoyltransferase complex transferase subunit TsaD [Chitinophagales bacterium]
GPGLMGALLVGTCFARSFAQALGIPMVAVDHLQAHVMAHFIRDGSGRPTPEFPFLNLTVSGGHTLLVRVDAPLEMTILGSTLDDAAGEAFDKGAKMLGLPYPGGPLIDRLADEGDARAFDLPRPRVAGLDMSFSGLKTAFHDLLQRLERERPGALTGMRNDLAASLQLAIIDILLDRTREALRREDYRGVAIS